MHKEFEIDVLRRGGKYIVFEEGGGCTSSGTAYIICRILPRRCDTHGYVQNHHVVRTWCLGYRTAGIV